MAEILTRALDCSSVSREPTLFRLELNLDVSALTVSFGWVRSSPRSHPFSPYVMTDHSAFLSSCGLLDIVGR